MNSHFKKYRLFFSFPFFVTTAFLSACQIVPANGQITLRNSCNGFTTGILVNGKFNGQVNYSCSNGDRYIGEVLDGIPHGQGIYYFSGDSQSEGEKHVGEYRDGKRDGPGTYTFANGNKYVGEFKDNQFNGQGTLTSTNGEKYVGEFKNGTKNGKGTWTSTNGERYVGEFKDGKKHGKGTFTRFHYRYVGEFRGDQFNGQGTAFFPNGDKYAGEFKDDQFHGPGIVVTQHGDRTEGIWENGKFLRGEKVYLPDLVAFDTNLSDMAGGRQQLGDEQRLPEEENRRREKRRRTERVNLQITYTQPARDGVFEINAQTNADTASLKINGEEQGGRADGDYLIKKVARAGQETKFTIVATDINGNTDTKIIAVSRAVVESKGTFAALNPANIKKQVERDAVAVVIGIADYRSLPKAEFANDDARAFYDYVIRALGIKPENIKLLVDGDADEAEILKTFRTWLPSRVKSTTEVFVFYSGHGLAMQDGTGLYLVPPRADREVIDDTAIPFSKINAALTLAKPKSVTIFLDACYSGQARSGETLLASARPVQLKNESRFFPDNFTVITASKNDQISSSNPELRHGIFSYYLMKGMEGDADVDRDGKITLGEMQSYLTENVRKHAAMMGLRQEPQLIGDVNRILVGR